VSLNNSETWKWKNWQISWSLSKASPSKKNIKKLNTNIFMHTLFSLFQISDRNRDNVRSYKESCQLAFAKRIRRVSKEMAKIIPLKIF